jgi:hypothetical protein
MIPETSLSICAALKSALRTELKSQLHHQPRFGVEDKHIETAGRSNTYFTNSSTFFPPPDFQRRNSLRKGKKI